MTKYICIETTGTEYWVHCYSLEEILDDFNWDIVHRDSVNINRNVVRAAGRNWEFFVITSDPAAAMLVAVMITAHCKLNNDDRRREINEYYDSLREEARQEDYTRYDYPDMVYSARIEEIEASRRMELDALENE